MKLVSTFLRRSAMLVGAGALAAAGLLGANAPAQADESESVWDRVAACESSGDWSINTGNGYYGGLQFSLQTWKAFGGEGMPHEASREEQIRIAQKTLAVQGPGAWPTCGKKAGLTKANGAADDGGASEAEKDEDAKAEEPKKDEPKPEEPKAEEPKKDEPKAEEPPAPEEPKAEEPKAEEPKAEEPKAEEPKPEEPAAEEPAAPEEPTDDAPADGTAGDSADTGDAPESDDGGSPPNGTGLTGHVIQIF
ncbi:hypothetical protein GCM10009700_09880 [Brevibacterium sanguinis]